MKHGLARNSHLYSVDTQEGEVIFSPAADYIQAQLWVNKNMNHVDEGVRDAVYFNIVWAWFAAKRNNMLDRFGLPEELTVEALDEMTASTTVYLDSVKDDSLPLATHPAKSRK